MQKRLKSERAAVIDELARRADLPMLAEELGMRVIGRGSRTPRALCPFHEDRKPSLTFYPSDSTEKFQYHCHACGAHGDVYGLVMKLLNRDFRGALEWLSGRLQIPLPQGSHPSTTEPRQTAFQLAQEVFSHQTSSEKERLKQFAKDRGFESNFLEAAELVVVETSKLSRAAEKRGRETIENFCVTRLIRRVQLAPADGGVLPVELPLVDFFSKPRVLFTLRDDRGTVLGFAGRALLASDEPKYLYSPGFPRGETLYRLDHVRTALRARSAEAKKSVEIYVVEGLLDALRLESFGLLAVAIFGAQLTPSQAELLTQLARDLDRDGSQLIVHVFLDADVPGRKALRSIVPRLYEAITTRGAVEFLVDVILPPLVEKKSDPDDLLRGCVSQKEAVASLGSWVKSVMESLLIDALQCDPDSLLATCRQVPESHRLRAYREIERRLPLANWERVIERLGKR